MKFIKNHRYTLIIIIVFILLFCLGYKVKDILIPDNDKASYGNRLEDLTKYEIDKSLFTKINAEIVKDKVKDLTYRFQGKIINFTILVSDDATITDAKEIGNKILKYFDQNDLSYYTIQIFIKKNDEKLNNFPIIGTKNPNNEEMSWTQNREITKEVVENEE